MLVDCRCGHCVLQKIDAFASHNQSKLLFVENRTSSPNGDVVVAVVADAANAPLSEGTSASRRKHSIPILKLKHESLMILVEFSR